MLSILEYYSGNMANALIHLYPDVKFDIQKFTFKGMCFSTATFFLAFLHTFSGIDGANIPQHRQILLEYAKDKNFDPFDANNWYNITQDILTHKVHPHNLFYIITLIILRYLES